MKRADDNPNDLLKPAIKLLQDSPGLGANAKERAEVTLACHDSDYIPKVKNAGKTVKIGDTTVQVMHNGIYVKKGAYQGEWQAKVIEGLQGIHEPQEEKVFFEVLKRIETGGTILELGSWWSYYSLWFLRAIKSAKAICCEPDPENLALGELNSRLNNYSSPENIIFYNSAAGSSDGKIINFITEKNKKIKVPVRSVDSLLEEQKIKKLDILHMDIQGAELDALRGAAKSIKEAKVRFLFVSTHHYLISGDPLTHQKCLDFIIKNGGSIIAEHTVAESCSGDGLIVASFDSTDRNFEVSVSLQHTNRSLFRQPEKDLGILWQAHDELLKRNTTLNKQIEQADLVSKKQDENLKWLYTHPIRFSLASIYHIYIKRDRRRGEIRKG